MASMFNESVSGFIVSSVELAATWWLQSTILLALGLAVAAWLQRRGPAIQSVVYRVTLGAVLLCPIATYLLSALGVSLLTIDLRPLSSANAFTAPPAVNTDAGPVADHLSESIPMPSLAHESSIGSLAPPDLLATQQGEFDIAPQTRTTAGSPAVAPELDIAVAPVTAPEQEPAIGYAHLVDLAFPVLVVALALWAIGTLWFAGQLLFCLVHTEALRRDAAPGEELAEEVCRHVATQLGVRTPRVLATPFLSSPCLLGHWRPAVLVPEETTPSTYHQLFLHELAHLQRCDWLWNLIGRFAHALLWFQPLVWILVRRDATVAEDVCDDYVLEHGCNREGYVRQLLDIAEKSAPQPAITGVSMVGFRSKLGRRAHRILDTSRVLCTRTSRLFALLALVVTLVATASVATVVVGQTKLETDNQNNEVTRVETHRREGKADVAQTGTNDNVASSGTLGEDRAAPVVRYAGRVLTPDGKPAAGAEVSVRYAAADDGGKLHFAQTLALADGRFTLDIDKSRFYQRHHPTPWKHVGLVATLDGFGFATGRADKLDKNAEITLRLVKDRPIRGRVLSLEGTPAANARVTVGRVSLTNDGKLDGYIKALADGQVGNYRMAEYVDLPDIAAVTKQDGRFEIAGLGEHRAVFLGLRGKGLQDASMQVLTTDLDPALVKQLAGPDRSAVYGAEFEFYSQPGRSIIGRVVDSASGEPLEGVEVTNYETYDGQPIFTDPEGRFAVDGIGKGKKHWVYLSFEKSSYLNRSAEVVDTPGLGPIKATIKMYRGLVASGQVLDQNGNPRSDGNVGYVPLYPNEHSITHQFNPYPHMHRAVQEDGGFTIPVLPGPGLIYFQPWSRGDYADAVVTQEDVIKAFGSDTPIKAGNFMDIAVGVGDTMAMGAFSVPQHASATLINPAKGVSLVKTDVQVVISNAITGLVFGPDGSPANDVGLRFEDGSNNAKIVNSNEFEVRGYNPDSPRQLAFVTKDRKLGARLLLEGKQNSPLRVTLQPTGFITGRLLDGEGEPRKGQVVQLNLEHHIGAGLVASRTDSDGRFELKGVVPGVKHWLQLREGSQILRDVTVGPGKTFDVGDVSSDAKMDEMLRAKEADQALIDSPNGTATRPTATQPVAIKTATKETDQRVTLQGQVIDAAGGVVADASIIVVAENLDVGSHAKREVVLRTKSDAAGKFSVSVEKPVALDNQRMHGSLNIVASKSGWGTGWSPVRSNEFESGRVSVPLHEEKVITGRLVDLEGQPLSGIQVAVTGLVAAKGDTDLDAWHARAAKNPSAMKQSHMLAATSVGGGGPDFVRFPGNKWLTLNGVQGLKRTVTKKDGTFDVRGVARDHQATLAIAGTGIADTLINVLAREMETVNMPTIDSRFGTQKLYGANFSYAAHPSRLIRGTVVDKETKKPLIGVQIEVAHTIHNRLGTQTIRSDQQGRFQIPNLPAKGGLRLRVKADHIPYFRPEDIEVPKSNGPNPIDVSIELERGEWIRGRLTDATTGEPIEAGWVSYYPFHDNKNAEKFSHFRLDMITVGHGDRVPTSPDGTYRIVGIPGRGIVLGGATNAAIYKRGVGAEQIDGLLIKTGPRLRVYHLISADMGNTVVEASVTEGVGATCDIALEQHDRRSFRVVDQQGKPLTRYRVTGHLPGGMNVANPILGESPPRAEANFDVLGLANGRPRTLLLRHDARKLGLATFVGGADKATGNTKDVPQLELLPTASISGRALDTDRKPAKGATAHLAYPIKRGPSLSGKQALTGAEWPLTSTDVQADGSFSFDAIPPGISYILYITRTGNAQTKKETSKLSPGQKVNVGEIVLKPKSQENGDAFE